MPTRNYILFFMILLLGLLSACSPPMQDQSKPLVVASTTVIGDIVGRVAGDLVDLQVLLPSEADPHSFSPAPKDVALVERASLIFVNGFKLEEGLLDLILANAQGKIVTVSEGMDVLMIGAHDHDEGVQADTDKQLAVDPHVWMDPANVKIWVENIVEALSEADPGNTADYQQNAAAYLTELDSLISWITAEVGQIPEEQRILITDHDSLGYFAAAYGFQIVGVVVIGGSTLSDPSAQQIAALEETITQTNTPAIFVGTTVNTQLAERIANDTGTVLVPLYTGSLSSEDGPAQTYIEMMRYNIGAIVEALK